jgi:uncharacterized protein with HEPN domain
MPTRDLSHLEDMLHYGREALRFAGGKTFSDYCADSQLQLAVERAVEIVGEAANRISSEFQMAHSDLPWAKIVRQRNVLVHEYGDVDPALMWGLVRKHLPDLVTVVERWIGEVRKASGEI